MNSYLGFIDIHLFICSIYLVTLLACLLLLCSVGFDALLLFFFAVLTYPIQLNSYFPSKTNEEHQITSKFYSKQLRVTYYV